MDVLWPPDIAHFNCVDERFQFFNLHAYGHRGMLDTHVFNGSGFAKGYNGLSDADVMVEVLAVLHSMFFKPDHRDERPWPTDYVVTRWDSDPFSLGSYCFWKTGEREDEIRKLANTEHDRIMFAGEHTCTGGYQCVARAFQSGARAATDVVAASGVGRSCKKVGTIASM